MHGLKVRWEPRCQAAVTLQPRVLLSALHLQACDSSPSLLRVRCWTRPALPSLGLRLLFVRGVVVSQRLGSGSRSYLTLPATPRGDGGESPWCAARTPPPPPGARTRTSALAPGRCRGSPAHSPAPYATRPIRDGAGRRGATRGAGPVQPAGRARRAAGGGRLRRRRRRLPVRDGDAARPPAARQGGLDLRSRPQPPPHQGRTEERSGERAACEAAGATGSAPASCQAAEGPPRTEPR
jgi:hypothetical protein